MIQKVTKAKQQLEILETATKFWEEDQAKAEAIADVIYSLRDGDITSLEEGLSCVLGLHLRDPDEVDNLASENKAMAEYLETHCKLSQGAISDICNGVIL